MTVIERWRVCENFDTHSRFVVKPGENLARNVVHEPGVFEITELVPADQLQGAVEALLKYGRHASNCATRGELHCTCGWEAARARFEQTP